MKVRKPQEQLALVVFSLFSNFVFSFSIENKRNALICVNNRLRFHYSLLSCFLQYPILILYETKKT